MANDIDEVLFEVDAGLGSHHEPVLYENPPRVTTKAHPFTEADLIAFAASGEHPGLEWGVLTG